MHLFSLFFFIPLLAFVLIIAIFQFVVRSVFSKRRRTPDNRNPYQRNTSRESSYWGQSSPSGNKKVFDKTDGEYVDFEEIKDEK